MNDDEACGHCGVPRDVPTWRCATCGETGASVIEQLVHTIIETDWSRPEWDREPWHINW